ncbi:hypothetical protein JCM17823_07330 [Halorubrum gandharaense]
MTDLDASPAVVDLADVAAEAALAAGDRLASAFRTGHVVGEYGTDDVKTEIDERAERAVLDVLDERVPPHATHGEETGRRGEHDHVWVIDPLDGTNNFAAGLPSFATAVCCVRNDEPVAAAVYEPLPESLYLAVAGGSEGTGDPGASADARLLEGDALSAVRDDGVVAVNRARPGDASGGVELALGTPLRADSETPLEHATVSSVVGLPAVRDPQLRAESAAVRDALAPLPKRVLETWSPCVDWGLLARGGTEAVVAFHPDPYEQYPGSLLAETAGAAVRSREGLYVAAADERVADRLFDAATGAVETADDSGDA